MRAGALPGQSLVVWDPVLGLVVNVVPCEDGHAQERSLLDDILAMVEQDDLWIADRNFCTTKFLFGIARRLGFFLIRQHASTLTWEFVGTRKRRGKTDSGRVYEQDVRLHDPETGESRLVRRITVVLNEATRDGETEIHLLTNVPEKDANARTVVKASMRAVHGQKMVTEQVSWYYLCMHLAKVYGGMMIAVPAQHWRVFQKMTDVEFVRILKHLAGNINLAKFRKHPRGPKKPPPKKASGAKIKHVATARILAKR